MTEQPAQYKVQSNNNPSRVRTLFQGLEKDARRFIENNFPRPHVEPGTNDEAVPDVALVAPDGSKETYHAEDGWSGKPEAAAPAAEVKPGSDLA
jgi:hypothetical protein